MKQAIAAVCMLYVLAWIQPARAEDAWKVIDRSEEGYEVASLDVAGREVPTMRGRGVLRGDILHVLAILLDAGRLKEWAEGVTWTKVLQQEGGMVTLFHTYAELTWPVADRDVISRAKLTVRDKGQEYELATYAEPTALPEQDGVVRIKHTSAHFLLKKQGEDKVWVEYVVDSDPGGKLPKWLIRWASKKVPGETLRKLQAQVNKTRGQYDASIRKLAALP
jgi:hypothetical protein